MSQPKPRGRPASLTDDARRLMFLRAVYDHPWAGPGLIEAYSGLYEKEVLAARRWWARQKALYAAQYITGKKSPARYALRQPGALELGEPCQPGPLLRETLFRVETLDVARTLLTEWAYQPGLAWSLSPFEVSAADTRLPAVRVETAGLKPPAAFSRPRALKLAALGCARFAGRRFVNFVVLVDPGEIVIRWFYTQFRSFHRWGQRREFRQRKAAFPVFIFVAANSTRLEQALHLWRAAAAWGHRPEYLFATTRWQASMHKLGERLWWNEKFGRVSLWSGVAGVAVPSVRADRLPPAHWDHHPPFTERPASEAPTIVAVRPPFGKRPARKSLIALHQRLSPAARDMLRLIGRYPLLKPRDLSLLLSCTKSFVSQCLAELKPLYKRLKESGGLVLSSEGLALLAAQIGFSARDYASLRRWPIRTSREPGKRPAIALETAHLEKERYDHARMALDLMIGLVQVSRRLPLRLVGWDLEYIYVFRNRQGPAAVPGREGAHLTVVPDAVGSVIVTLPNGAVQATEFWLEVDRGQHRGARLRRKLAKYYQASAGHAGAPGWLPRLLIVVNDDAEGRAQAQARRIRQLDDFYGRSLDVMIARCDQLRRPDGILDPARQRWRRPEKWDALTFAFDGLQVLEDQRTGASNANPKPVPGRGRAV